MKGAITQVAWKLSLAEYLFKHYGHIFPAIMRSVWGMNESENFIQYSIYSIFSLCYLEELDGLLPQ